MLSRHSLTPEQTEEVGSIIESEAAAILGRFEELIGPEALLGAVAVGTLGAVMGALASQSRDPSGVINACAAYARETVTRAASTPRHTQAEEA